MPSGGIAYKAQDVNQDEVKTHQQQQSKTVPIDAVVEDFSKSLETPSAAIPTSRVSSVKQQLLEFAAARSIPLPDADASALVESWPAAKLADGELIGALTVDFARYSLDEMVSGEEPAKMVKHDAARLRWFLCVWPAFKESTDDYQQKTGGKWSKTRCFLKKWKVDQPPADWLEGQVRALKYSKSREAHELGIKEAQAFWSTLSARQKRALDQDAVADLREKHPATHFDLNSPETRDRRWEMLRESETRQWLLELPAASEQVQTPESQFNEADYDDIAAIASPVQLRFESIIGAILQDVGAGKVTLARLDSARPSLLEDNEWSEVKREVTLRLAA